MAHFTVSLRPPLPERFGLTFSGLKIKMKEQATSKNVSKKGCCGCANGWRATSQHTDENPFQTFTESHH